jgi:3-dehydroquinate synthase
MGKKAEDSYIKIQKDVFDSENDALAKTMREVAKSSSPRVLIVADLNVVQRTQQLGVKIGKYFNEHGIQIAGAPAIIGGGEKIKSDDHATFFSVVSAIAESKIGINDIILAIGGGAVLDVVLYAAAQMRGGINCIIIPTTPASMVDYTFSTIAKINYKSVKDALRINSRIASVLIDTSFIETVLEGVWRGGIGEIVRFASVNDAKLMKKIAANAEALKNRDCELMAKLIEETVESRKKKGGTNLGLWSALRLQAMSNYKLPHGYAVPMGITIDCAYAVSTGVLSEKDQRFICETLDATGTLEGFIHSKHLIRQTENILYGLDAWALSSTESITIPSGIGKHILLEQPDKTIYEKVLTDLIEATE